jgi:hypothetical protein
MPCASGSTSPEGAAARALEGGDASRSLERVGRDREHRGAKRLSKRYFGPYGLG